MPRLYPEHWMIAALFVASFIFGILALKGI